MSIFGRTQEPVSSENAILYVNPHLHTRPNHLVQPQHQREVNKQESTMIF